jgi:hypothetical protein
LWVVCSRDESMMSQACEEHPHQLHGAGQDESSKER